MAGISFVDALLDPQSGSEAADRDGQRADDEALDAYSRAVTSVADRLAASGREPARLAACTRRSPVDGAESASHHAGVQRTYAHVVAQATDGTRVLLPARARVPVGGADPLSDLAVCGRRGVSPRQRHGERTLRVGHVVFAIGNPARPSRDPSPREWCRSRDPDLAQAGSSTTCSNRRGAQTGNRAAPIHGLAGGRASTRVAGAGRHGRGSTAQRERSRSVVTEGRPAGFSHRRRTAPASTRPPQDRP